MNKEPKSHVDRRAELSGRTIAIWHKIIELARLGAPGFKTDQIPAEFSDSAAVEYPRPESPD